MKVISTRVITIWISLAMACLFFAGVSYAKIDPADVAGMWLFDNDDDEIAEDSSGNGNHGEFRGKPEFVDDGVFGKALEFDGDDFVSIPDSDSLDMGEHMTVMFWFRSDKEMADMWADRQIVVGKHYTEYEIGIYMDGQLHTYTSDGAADYDEGIMTTIAGKLPDKDADWEVGKWYHIAWTLNGQQEIAYVNGIELGEHNKAHENTKPGTNNLEIGQRVGNSLQLTGAVDEVIVLNVALEIEDIEVAVEEGLLVALGLAAVSPGDKLATTWGRIKD